MIVISGASGFIGKNLLNKLENVKGVSLRDNDWKEELSKASIIINLVGKAHDHRGIATEEDFTYVNVNLTQIIFTIFIKSSARLLIHVSSLAALEEFESIKPLEETDQCKPTSFYGNSKRTAEEWLLAQKLPEGKKLVILRPPMVHGPGDKGNLGMLYNLISKGIPYPLSSFDNKRSFISIDNFIFFIQHIIKKQEVIPSGIYHIADDEPVSTRQIISIIKKVTNKHTFELKVPKFLVKLVALIGDVVPIPLNTKRLRKLTSTLLVSNKKIKCVLDVDELPVRADLGIERTIKSFSKR